MTDEQNCANCGHSRRLHEMRDGYKPYGSCNFEYDLCGCSNFVLAGAAVTDPYLMLRMLASQCRGLEAQLESLQRSRDQAALALVADGHTWREVADEAGFANPYIAQLKRKAKR